MSKKDLVNSFIEKLVVNFDNNEITFEIIKKLREVDDFDSVIVDGNKIKCVFNNHNNEIIINELGKEIVFKDRDSAVYDDKKMLIETENHYIEDNNGYHIDTKKTTEETGIIDKDDSVYVVSETIKESSSFVDGIKVLTSLCSKTIDRYKNDVHVYSSVSNVSKKYKDHSIGLTLLDSSSNKKDLYLLANGDVLKIENQNGKEDYYYCDSSLMYPSDINDDSKAKFNVKIDYSSFVKILENVDNAIDIVENNKLR